MISRVIDDRDDARRPTHRLTDRVPPRLLPPAHDQESGIGASDVKKLVDAGVHTVEGLARASRKQLAQIKGLSEQKVEKLKQIGACTRVVAS